MNEKLDLKTGLKLLESFSYILKFDKPFDIVTQTLDLLKNVLGCCRATLFPLDFHTVQLTTTKLNRERKKCVHQMEIENRRDHSSTTVAAICKEDKDLCKEPLFDDVKNPRKDVIVSDDGSKLALLVR